MQHCWAESAEEETRSQTGPAEPTPNKWTAYLEEVKKEAVGGWGRTISDKGDLGLV